MRRFPPLPVAGTILCLLAISPGVRALGLPPATDPVAILPLPWSPIGSPGSDEFGLQVAPAGDVNGDGFGDVLVATSEFTGGQADEGKVWLYLGSASGIDTTADWSFESNQAGSRAASSIAPAGDVNGDGYGDVIVGAPYHDVVPWTDSGAAFVFHGGPGGLSPVPNTQLVVMGVDTPNLFGEAVASAGDVNGDGYADVLVGASLFRPNAGVPNAGGGAFVFLGGSAGVATTPAQTYFTGELDAEFGSVLSGAGDINADGYADFVVAAPRGDFNAMTRNGYVHVYLGGPGGPPASPDSTFAGPTGGDGFGATAANAGDVNGDGYADVLIGAPNTTGMLSVFGTARVYGGGPGGLTPTTLLVAAGEADFALLGYAGATAGDVDGDGYADVLVSETAPEEGSGVTGPGAVHLYFGGKTGMTHGGTIDAPIGAGQFGSTVATSSDTDGDGKSEILLGDPAGDIAPGDDAGRAYLYRAETRLPALAPGWPRQGAMPGTRHGSALAILPSVGLGPYGVLLIGERGHDVAATVDAGRFTLHEGQWGTVRTTATGTFAGTGEFENLGSCAVDAGDVNRDGYSDFLVAAGGASPGGVTAAGRVDVYKGASGMPQFFDGIDGDQALARLGNAIAGRGDVNGDGYHDVLVAAREWDSPTLVDCGKVWLYYGGPTGLGATPWTAEGTLAQQGLGASVAFVDFDADGYTDVVVGTVTTELFTPTIDGRIDLWYGGPGGLVQGAPPAWSTGAQFTEPGYGGCLANLGDISGDDVADLAVGAPGENGVGRVYVYFGARGRERALRPARTYDGTQQGAAFGAVIAGGGDLDGDGIADFAIGEPYYDFGGFNNAGRVHVYRGAPNGPTLAPVLLLTQFFGEGEFGSAIAPLADLNDDSIADLAIGVPGGNAIGRVYVYLGVGGGGAPQDLKLTEAGFGGLLRYAPGRAASASALGVAQYVRSAGGRMRAQPEVEVRLNHEPFSGVPNRFPFAPLDTGVPQALFGSVASYSASVTAPDPDAGYRARARSSTRSPYFPRTRWLDSEGRVAGDHHLWTSGTAVGVAPGRAVGGARLTSIAPNPSHAGGAGPGAAVRIGFTLPRAGHATLDVYDVRGAHVRRLFAGAAPAGADALGWDGRDDGDRATPAGIYFVVLRADGKVDRAKAIRLP